MAGYHFLGAVETSLLGSVSVRQSVTCQVTAEVHRAVEDADDLKRLALQCEEDDVLFVTGGAATF